MMLHWTGPWWPHVIEEDAGRCPLDDGLWPCDHPRLTCDEAGCPGPDAPCQACGKPHTAEAERKDWTGGAPGHLTPGGVIIAAGVVAFLVVVVFVVTAGGAW